MVTNTASARSVPSGFLSDHTELSVTPRDFRNLVRQAFTSDAHMKLTFLVSKLSGEPQVRLGEGSPINLGRRARYSCVRDRAENQMPNANRQISSDKAVQSGAPQIHSGSESLLFAFTAGRRRKNQKVG